MFNWRRFTLHKNEKRNYLELYRKIPSSTNLLNYPRIMPKKSASRLTDWLDVTLTVLTDHTHCGESTWPNVFKNQTRLQNGAYTTRKSLIFHVLCALFEQILSGISQEILKKILPDVELKIVTNSVHLVIWSCGFPTLIQLEHHLADNTLRCQIDNSCTIWELSPWPKMYLFPLVLLLATCTI